MPAAQAVQATSLKTMTPPSTLPASADSSSRKTTAERRQIHCVLTGKGGIGKTFAAWCMVQYLREKGIPTEAIDTDPVNRSLHGYAALRAKFVPILQADKVSIDVKEIDRLAETIFTTDSDFVIDNGAASFLPFGSYLSDTEFADFADQQGRDLVIHAIIAGGSSMAPTILGLDTVFRSFPPPARVVVWLNAYLGDLEVEGQKFHTMPIYTDNTKRISGVVQLPELATFGFRPNVQEMLMRHLTFQEAIDSPDFMLLEKQRLTQVRRRIWQQLDGAL